MARSKNTPKTKFEKPADQILTQFSSEEELAGGGDPVSQDKFLDSFQLRLISEATNDVTTARLEMAVSEQYLANLNLQIQNYQLLVEKQKLFVDAKASAYESAKTRYNDISKQIFSAHGIEQGNIGYDPISGKITA